jgi:hypothetical protein
MATVFSKTEAGQREIRERTIGLSRPSRTLLVLADGTRSEEQLLQMVRGSTPQDFASLVEAGLVTGNSARGGSSSGAASRDETPAPAAAEEVPAEAGVGLGYRELYDSLNALAKEQLGLFRGYKFVLEIEKANGVEGLREVAERFAEEVQKVKGDSAAQMVRRALGILN